MVAAIVVAVLVVGNSVVLAVLRVVIAVAMAVAVAGEQRIVGYASIGFGLVTIVEKCSRLATE